jgi:hypothetical protein
LLKLATAAIDLSGFATWREWQWHMRETGLRLLAWGLAQLWEGMSAEHRSRVRDRLQRTHKAIGWPADPTTDQPAYDGPEEIPLPDQYRLTSNYISCYRDYLDDEQKARNLRVERRQSKFLRRATLVQFVETAEPAAQALQAIVKREFDTPAEWDYLYTKAFWPLACLRRAHEIQPREAWPPDALEQRKLLADAAVILLTCFGGTSEAKATCKPEDANKAFENFTQAILRLRVITDRQAKESQSDDAARSPKNELEGAPIGLLGGVPLANALGVHASQRQAFIQQLGRKRSDLDDDCWQEVANPRPNSPRFLYCADSPQLRALAARYQTPKSA